MNAISHHRFSSVSTIAVASAIGQVVPFRAVQPVAEPVEAIAEPVVIAAEDIANDNIIAPPAIIETGPANALIERKAFTRAVEIALEAVERRNTIPILSNIRMESDKGGITITGTDLDLEIAVFVSAAVDQHFGTTLPGHTMKDLLKKAASSDFVEITTSDAYAKLDFERVTFDLQTLPTADFPDLSMGAAANTFDVKGADLFSMIDGTIDAVSKEATRYYLNGIYLHVLQEGNRRTLVAAATDGHRLYSQAVELPFGADDMAGSIIPRKTVDVLHKLMKGKRCPETVTIAINESKVRISFNNIVITSKLVDGTFPDYKRVIPAHNSKPVNVKASALIEATETVSLISTERGKAVKLTLAANASTMLLEVNNPDTGRAAMTIGCDYAGDAFEVGFNAKYLAAALKDASISSDDVTVTFEDAGSPAIITSSREGWCSVLMPMRV